jgi:hypothetical protein
MRAPEIAHTCVRKVYPQGCGGAERISDRLQLHPCLTLYRLSINDSIPLASLTGGRHRFCLSLVTHTCAVACPSI